MTKYLPMILVLSFFSFVACQKIIDKVGVQTLFTEDHAGNFLKKVEDTQKTFDDVAQNIDRARQTLYGFIANNERRTQIDERERLLADKEMEINQLKIELKSPEAKIDSMPKSSESSTQSPVIQETNEEKLQRLIVEADSQRTKLNLLKTEAIFKAKTNGSLEELRLSVEQVEQVGRVLWNLRLATLRNKSIIANSAGMINDGTKMIGSLKSSPLDLKRNVRVPKLKKAVDEDIPHMKVTSEEQVETIKAFTEATNIIRKSNDIPDPGTPTEDSEYIVEEADGEEF